MSSVVLKQSEGFIAFIVFFGKPIVSLAIIPGLEPSCLFFVNVACFWRCYCYRLVEVFCCPCADCEVLVNANSFGRLAFERYLLAPFWLILMHDLASGL